MKKISALLLSAILFLTVATGGVAAGTAKIRVTASSQQVQTADEITFSVTVSGADAAKAVGVIPSYDREVLELVSGTWEIAGLLSDFDIRNGNGVIAFEKPTDINTKVFTFVLKAKKEGVTSEVGCKTVIKTENGDAATETESVKITVGCDHTYSTRFNYDENSHWHVCTKCGARTGEEKHSPSAAATETTAQTCTVCGYVIEPIKNHTHDYEENWSFDEREHWKECRGCSEKTQTTAHEYDNDCDDTCNVCGAKRRVQHTYPENWEKSETAHWRVCSVCGFRDESAHRFTQEGNTRMCADCGYTFLLTEDHTHTFGELWESDEQNHWHSCACSEKSDVAPHEWEEVRNGSGVEGRICRICKRTERTASPGETSAADAQPKNPTKAWILWVVGGAVVLTAGVAVIFAKKRGKKA